jgi:hypothetical protein
MLDAIKPTLYKLRHTPVTDFLREGFTASLDIHRLLKETTLPVTVQQLIGRVVRRTRLWRSEKLDLQTELIGHFMDGMASGVSSEELIRGFGDESNAARLIRRAKLRNRPLFWRALQATLAFAAITGLPLLVFLVIWQWQHWDAMTRRIDALTTEAETRTQKRAVLHGVAAPGNAWDEYNIALGDSRPWGADAGNGGIFFRYAMRYEMNEQEKETARKLIAANAWRLDHLQLGAQRTDGQFPYRWRRGFGGDGPSLLRTRMLANLACAQARILVETGQGQKAADLLGDVAMFAQDLSTNAPMQSLLIGTAVYSTAFDVLRRLLQEGKFNREEMENLARSLDTIDRDFPKLNVALSNSIMGEGRFLIRASSTSWRDRRNWLVGLGGARELDWRFTIAPKTYVLDAFEQMDPYLQRIANLEDLPYTQAKAQADQISEENRKSSNYFFREQDPKRVSKLLAVQREPRALLRLVRAAIAVRTTGNMPVIPDPFGTTLHSRRNSNRITIWSLGRDGIDQNGKSDDTYQPDMVIEVSL